MRVTPSLFPPAFIHRKARRLPFSWLSISASFACLLADTGLALKPQPPDPKKVYPIVVEAAIGVLPPKLVERFQPYIQVIARAAAALDPGYLMTERREHYMVWLDFAAPEHGDREARLEAARTFPLDRESAKQSGYRTEPFGDLAYQLLDHYQALVEAFRAARWIDVREHAVWIFHYSTVVAFPSQMTREKRDLAPLRLELWLAEQIRARLEIEVRVFSGRFERANDIRLEILGKLRESHAAYFRLQDIERIARREAGVIDHASPYSRDPFASPVDKDFRRIFSERAGDVLCTQFKNAALLAANLIGTAWMDAGSPEVPMDAFAPRATDEQIPGATQVGSPKSGAGVDGKANGRDTPALVADLVADKFLGSSGSETYHRASCQHATRIKAENTIRFATLEEAERAGRKPCRVCQPDGK